MILVRIEKPFPANVLQEMLEKLKASGGAGGFGAGDLDDDDDDDDDMPPLEEK